VEKGWKGNFGGFSGFFVLGSSVIMSMLAVLWSDSTWRGLQRAVGLSGVSLAPKFLRAGFPVGILDVRQKICARLHRVVSRFIGNSRL